MVNYNEVVEKISSKCFRVIKHIGDSSVISEGTPIKYIFDFVIEMLNCKENKGYLIYHLTSNINKLDLYATKEKNTGFYLFRLLFNESIILEVEYEEYGVKI